MYALHRLVVTSVLLSMVLAFFPLRVRADDAALVEEAKRILESAWDEQPVPAARGLVIEGWGRLVVLDDKQVQGRLEEITRTPEHPNRAAAMKSLIYADDQTVYDEFMRTAKDPGQPRSERLAAIAIGTWWVDDAISPEAEELICAEAANPRHEKGMFRLLMDHATDQSRRPVEAMLREVLAGNTGPSGQTDGHVLSFRNRAILQQQDPSVCRIEWRVETLRHIGNPRSREVLWRVVRLPMNSEYSKERIHALTTLWELGDKEDAVRYLREAYGEESDPQVRVSCAAALVKAGEKAFLPTLRAGMDHPDDQVRKQTYAILRFMDDASYVKKAASDYLPESIHRPKYNGFHWLTGDVENVFPDHLREYLLLIAKNGKTGGARAAALGLLLQWDQGLEADHVLPLCRAALSAPVPDLPDTFPDGRWPDELRDLEAEWRWMAMRLVGVVRFGNEDERRSALRRMADMVVDGQPSGRDFMIADWLRYARSREAIPLLQAVMVAPNQSDLSRLKAAISVLEILAAEHNVWFHR